MVNAPQFRKSHSGSLPTGLQCGLRLPVVTTLNMVVEDVLSHVLCPNSVMSSRLGDKCEAVARSCRQEQKYPYERRHIELCKTETG